MTAGTAVELKSSRPDRRRISTRQLAAFAGVAAAAAPAALLAAPQVAAAYSHQYVNRVCAPIGASYTWGYPTTGHAWASAFALYNCPANVRSSGWIDTGIVIGHGSVFGTAVVDGNAFYSRTFGRQSVEYWCGHEGYAHQHFLHCYAGWS